MLLLNYLSVLVLYFSSKGKTQENARTYRIVPVQQHLFVTCLQLIYGSVVFIEKYNYFV